MSSTNKEKILIVPFGEIVVKPTLSRKICSFLNTKVSDYINVLKNENIPRDNKNKRHETLDKIKKLLKIL